MQNSPLYVLFECQCLLTCSFSIHIVYECTSLMPLNVLCLADGVSWLCSTGGLDREPPCLWHYIMCHLRKRPTPWHLIKNSSSLYTAGGFCSPWDVYHYHNIEYKRLKEKTIFMKCIWLKIVDRNISDDNKLRINSWLVEPGTSTMKIKWWIL